MVTRPCKLTYVNRGFGDGARASCGLWVVADRRNSYCGRVGGLQSTVITDKIAEDLRRGDLLDLAPDLALGSPVDEVVMMSWDDVRDLLLG